MRRVSASPYTLLTAAVLCISFGAILARVAQAPALTIAFYRMSLATLLVMPFGARAAWQSAGRLSPRQALALLAAGCALALHFATWIASLAYTSVAASVLLVNTTPLWSGMLAWWTLRERVPPGLLTALPLAACGSVLIAWGDWSRGPEPLRGDLLALAGAVSLAIHHVAGRGLRDALPLDAYVLAVWGVAALTLLAASLASDTPLAGYAPATWGALVALAVVPTLLGHGLVNRALRALPAPTVGLFLLGEPLGATLLAWLVFGERPPALTLAGGAVVSAALALLALRRPGA